MKTQAFLFFTNVLAPFLLYNNQNTRGPREPKKIYLHRYPEKFHYNTIYDWDVCGIFVQLYLSQYTAKMHRPSHFRRICVMKCHHLTKLGTEKDLQRFFVNMWSISPYHAKTAMTPWWDLFGLQLKKTTNR